MIYIDANKYLPWLPKAKQWKDSIEQKAKMSTGLKVPNGFVLVLPDTMRGGLIDQAKVLSKKGKYYCVIRGGDKSEKGEYYTQVSDNVIDETLDSWLVCHAHVVVGNAHELMMTATAIYRDGPELRVIGGNDLVRHGLAYRCASLQCAMNKKGIEYYWSTRKVFVAKYLMENSKKTDQGI